MKRWLLPTFRKSSPPRSATAPASSPTTSPRTTPCSSASSRRARSSRRAAAARIVQELEYAENGTFLWYSGYETLNVADLGRVHRCRVRLEAGGGCGHDLGPRAIAELRQQARHRPARGADRQRREDHDQQASPWACTPTAPARAARRSAGFSSSSPTAPSTGTVGGINRATYSFWRNEAKDATTDFGAAATSANYPVLHEPGLPRHRAAGATIRTSSSPTTTTTASIWKACRPSSA